jgi:hypothetical protein
MREEYREVSGKQPCLVTSVTFSVIRGMRRNAAFRALASQVRDAEHTVTRANKVRVPDSTL